MTVTKCKRSEVRTRDQPLAAAPAEDRKLGDIARADAKATMRVLGSEVQIQAHHELQFTHVFAKNVGRHPCEGPTMADQGQLARTKKSTAPLCLRILRMSYRDATVDRGRITESESDAGQDELSLGTLVPTMRRRLAGLSTAMLCMEPGAVEAKRHSAVGPRQSRGLAAMGRACRPTSRESLGKMHR